ncbi:MAG: fatty acid desaturase family protein [Alphaproteobacteria bacterium]
MKAGEPLRDYSLVGPDSAQAVERGLATAEWYRSDIPRKRMKELMKRSDHPALRDTVIWVGAMIVLGGLGGWFWGSWLAVPFFLAYGVLYGSSSDSRWHECGHGTAFRTRWMSDVVYQIASFMIMREPTVWRWSHTRHHTDTLIVGRDPEIVAMRPPRLLKIIANFFGLVDVPVAFRKMIIHATGRLTEDETTFIPEMERMKVYSTARIWLAIYAAVAIACVVVGSILPAMLIGLPRIYGTWLHLVFGLTQHAGLAEDVLDHRLNSRTVYMNPVLRFLYWNMNYHLEHHMFPMVPYHALPALHAEIKADSPLPRRGLVGAYREIIPAMLRQLRDPSHFVHRRLPDGARPFVSAGDIAAAE